MAIRYLIEYTTDEAANILGESRWTTLRRINRGEIKWSNAGTDLKPRIRISADALEDFIYRRAEGRVQAARPVTTPRTRTPKRKPRTDPAYFAVLASSHDGTHIVRLCEHEADANKFADAFNLLNGPSLAARVEKTTVHRTPGATS